MADFFNEFRMGVGNPVSTLLLSKWFELEIKLKRQYRKDTHE